MNLNTWIGALLILSAAGLAAPAFAEHADGGECNPYTSSDDCFSDTNNDANVQHPDCEEDQPAAGSNSETGDGGLRADGERGSNPLPAGGALLICEGEHYDGDHDYAQPDGDDPNEVHLTDLCDEKLVVAVSDAAGEEPAPGATDPVHARVSAKGSNEALYADNDGCSQPNNDPVGTFDDWRGELYVHVSIFSVGETSASAIGDGGHLDPGTQDGNVLGSVLVGWYGEDHTPLNVLATAISAAGITRGHVADDDCDFAKYETTREDRECGRDNTAITVDLNI